MKQLKYILLSLVLTACVSDEVVDSSNLEKAEAAAGDGRISFVQRVGNMTRSATVAQRAGHYEFGVWAYKGDVADKQISGGEVMDDYLVAYTDGTDDGINSWYKTLAANAETYGQNSGGVGETVPGSGISSWFYEGLGNTPGYYKTQSSPAASIEPLQTSQALKFWDKSVAVHNFFAYAPYFGHQAGAETVELTENASSQNVLTYSKLSTFYTDPVEQTTVANTTWAGTYPLNPAYNAEVLNSNEGLYAAQSVAKANYGKDVPLTFKHLNAKINIAFYEAVDGYSVQLLDLVPETEAANIYGSGTLTQDKNLIPATGGYQGVALSPATKDQAIVTMSPESSVVNSTTPLPSYYTRAKTIATDVRETATNDASVTLGAGSGEYAYDNKNLRFQIPTGNISETGDKGATKLPTTYYALPNWDGSDYLTQNYTADYTTQRVAENTGYTLHVSYKLIPKDGSDPDIVYDARVWVAPEYCKWQAGKQYTYVFKITQFTNGTTDPYISSNGMFGDGDNDQPYVDPDDPRVPSSMALVPIIFDNVFVSDYEKADFDASYLNVLNWTTVNYSSTDYKYCPVLMTGSEYHTALSYHPLEPLHDYVTAVPVEVGGSVFSALYFTFTGGSERKFTIGDMSFFADAKETYDMPVSDIKASATFASLENELHMDISTIARAYWNTLFPSGTIELPQYSMHIWTADDATTAEKYTATPVATAVIVTPAVKVMQTTVWCSNDQCYKVTTKNYTYTTPTETTKYYNRLGAEITSSQYTTLKNGQSDKPAEYQYTFTYKYSVKATDGYTLSSASVSGPQLPRQAYGIAKQP